MLFIGIGELNTILVEVLGKTRVASCPLQNVQRTGRRYFFRNTVIEDAGRGLRAAS